MDFDRLKENNGVYYYPDNLFNTIQMRLNFLCGDNNRDCAISDLLCYYLTQTNQNFESEDAIFRKSKELYSQSCSFTTALHHARKVFSFNVDMISPEVVHDDYYKEAFNFARQLLKEPDFTHEVLFEIIKRNVIDALYASLGDTSQFALNAYHLNVFPEKDRVYEYTSDVEYVIKLFESITLDDLKEQYEYIMSHFQSGLVFGNIPEDKFDEFVSTMDLEKTVDKIDYGEEGAFTIEEDIEIPREGDQSYIYVTYDIDNYTQAQLILLLKILNSPFLGLCYQTFREKHDLVYSSFCKVFFYAKKMFIHGEIDKDKKEEFLEAIDEIVSALQDKEKLAELIKRAKDLIKNDEDSISEDQLKLITAIDDYALGLFGGNPRPELYRQVEEQTPESMMGVTRSLKRRNVFMVRGCDDEEL